MTIQILLLVDQNSFSHSKAEKRFERYFISAIKRWIKNNSNCVCPITLQVTVTHTDCTLYLQIHCCHFFLCNLTWWLSFLLLLEMKVNNIEAHVYTGQRVAFFKYRMQCPASEASRSESGSVSKLAEWDQIMICNPWLWMFWMWMEFTTPHEMLFNSQGQHPVVYSCLTSSAPRPTFSTMALTTIKRLPKRCKVRAKQQQQLRKGLL